MEASARVRRIAAVAVTALVVWSPLSLRADEARLKDVVTLRGASPAPLIGYGLVVGLAKTGDKQQTLFTTQAIANMLLGFGLSVPADQIKIADVASVLVTAEMPAYAQPGMRLDITASAIGDANSLQGGTLLATPLHGANGEIVAIGQGPLSIGGFGGGSGGSTVQVNHLTVGRVPGGAVLQVGSASKMVPTDTLTLVLRDPDFVTASRVAAAINGELKVDAAQPADPASVVVHVPAEFRQAVPEFMARLEELTVETDTVARVVINERTGTVVIGGNVRVGPAAVAHGNLSVRITTHYDVSQPSPMSSGGTTQVVPQQQVDVSEGAAKLMTLEEGATLEAVTRALNSLGASPRDIIAIVQALKAAGALKAEIVIL